MNNHSKRRLYTHVKDNNICKRHLVFREMRRKSLEHFANFYGKCIYSLESNS